MCHCLDNVWRRNVCCCCRDLFQEASVLVWCNLAKCSFGSRLVLYEQVNIDTVVADDAAAGDAIIKSCRRLCTVFGTKQTDVRFSDGACR